MKRKDMQKAIEEAKSNDVKIREKVVIFENVLSFIFGISDRERCDYYDAVLLYMCYGIVPNFATLSTTKAQQFRLIFSLLKKQRIGWENSCKSDTSENLPTDPNPNPNPDQVYKDKKYISKEDNKEKEEKINPPLSPKGETGQKSKFDFDKIFEGYDAEWIELFKQWLDYKREKKNMYKGEKSIMAMAKKLFEMAGGDIKTAKAIVEQSMANNWQGLFDLKTGNNVGGKSDHYKGDDTIGTNFVRRGLD